MNVLYNYAHIEHTVVVTWILIRRGNKFGEKRMVVRFHSDFFKNQKEKRLIIVA